MIRRRSIVPCGSWAKDLCWRGASEVIGDPESFTSDETASTSLISVPRWSGVTGPRPAGLEERDGSEGGVCWTKTRSFWRRARFPRTRGGVPGEAAAPFRGAAGAGYKDAEARVCWRATLRADGSVMLGDMARLTATALGEFGFLV